MSNKKTIGFICPISKEGTETKKRSDEVMEHMIKPVARDLGYNVQRADHMVGGDIIKDIITMLHESDIVVADLSEFNPNVFYELGIRQAIKGKCINIIWNQSNENGLPFDLNHFRAHNYSFPSTFSETEAFRDYIKKRILNLEKEKWDPCMEINNDDFTSIFNITIVKDFLKGKKNHYGLAMNLFTKPCKTIFLMQRSSSLVLNAEEEWPEEQIFLDNIRSAIDECQSFYHIISLEGIVSHFKRKDSVFPKFHEFANNLINKGGHVAIKSKNNSNKPFYLHKLPPDNKDPFFKLDRQARVLITEDIDGLFQAVIVQNLGSDQTCFLLQGAKVKDYLQECISYFSQCELVEWNEIVELYKQYEKIEEFRGKGN